MVDTGRAQLDGQLHARAGAELVAVHPQPQPGRAGRPSSTARASSPSKACGDAGSQNTSIQRAYGAAAAQHRAGDQVEVAGPVVALLRRHDVGAEEGGLGGELGRPAAAPGPRRRRSARSRS